MTISQKDQAMFHIKRQRTRKPRHAPYTQSGKPTVVKEYDKPKRDQFTPPMWPSTPR